MWIQKRIQLAARSRGFHLITREIEQSLPELGEIECGLLHLMVQHTSASICINENADPDVRHDLEAFVSRTVPENAPYFKHVLEGADDMPAHIKSVLIGCELTIPVSDGRLCLGTWQGIYLGEHRNRAGTRTIVATLQGQQNSTRNI